LGREGFGYVVCSAAHDDQGDESLPTAGTVDNPGAWLGGRNVVDLTPVRPVAVVFGDLHKHVR